MAASFNRSPSPISNRQNPNIRNSETNSKMRRSFSGNPFTRPSMLTNPKSFNPVTPANSPSDFGRRHTTGKEGFVVTQGFEEKENDKDQNLKPVKVRSPAIVKSSKNFMSPTISAASKFTPSPRKKVLTERNEPVRTSVSYSDGKGPFSSLNVSEDTEAKPEMGLNYKKVETPSCDSTFPDLDHKEEVVLGPHSTSNASQKDTFFCSQVTSSSLKVSDSLSETITIESDCVSVDTTSKIKPSFSSVSPIIAPLDADPFLPPYDPKTNYLSPRPQFLHYKPNPRTELYLNKAKGLNFGDGKTLEDSCMSENFSDTEGTEESQSEDSFKESEDDSSAEIITEEEEPHVSEEEEEPHISEPKPISTSNSTHLSDETVETKRVPRPKFFTRSKSVSLILVLLIACLSISVTDYPVIDSSVINDLSLSMSYDPSEIVVFAQAIFDGFARNFKHWTANCISYLSRLINIPGGDKLGPLQFSNLTVLQEDLLVDGYLKFDFSEDKSEESYEQDDDLEPAPEGEVEMELLEEKGQPEAEADDEISEEASQEHIDPEIEDIHLTIQAEVMEADSCSQEIQNQESDFDFPINTEPQSNEVFEDQSVLSPQVTEIEAFEVKHDVAVTGEFQGDNDLDLGATTESTTPLAKSNEVFEDQSVLTPQATEIEAFEIKHDVVVTGEFQDTTTESNTPLANPEISSDTDPSFGGVQSLERLSTSLHGPEDKLSLHERTSLLVLALALVSAIAVIYSKQWKTTSPNAVVHVDPLLTKKLISSSISPSNEHTYQYKAASHNWQTEVDVAGESLPSEMSSFQKSSSYGKKVLDGANEAQSQERRLRKNSRRESLASSSDYSMGSPSYGSFTTYEKISSKHGCGDEETVTPVRRSSRIRSQITSP